MTQSIVTKTPPDRGGQPLEGDAIAMRQRWMGVLARAGAEALEQAWETLDARPEYRHLRPPESGMAMVRGRAGGTGRPFNLGEMTMTRCSVRLNGSDCTVGHGYVAGRDKRHAELAALFDALLQVRARRDALLRDVIEPLEAAQAEARQRRQAQTAATRVDFFTMVRGEDD